MHAIDFLSQPEKTEIKPVVVLYGADRFLQQSALKTLQSQVLGEGDEEMGLVEFTGKDADLKSVLDEARTISMWGDSRLVVVDAADEFVSANRPGLEKYVQKPSSKSVLVLKVKSWPKNTKIAKQTAKTGLVMECSELKGAKLVSWLVKEADQKFEKKLGREAASLLVELVGNSLGQLGQELEKLANYAGDEQDIRPETVRTLVGGWKAETTWVMLDSLRDGNLNHALTCYDQLLTAGEAPQRLLGGIAFQFKKLVKATELSRQGIPLNEALKTSGIFPRDIAVHAAYLRKIGRPRAEKILQMLLQVESDIKGGSRISDRIQLERLMVQLSGKSS